MTHRTPEEQQTLLLTQKLMPLMPQLMALQQKAAAASREYTAALGANDQAREIKANRAVADAEEAVAAMLAPLQLSPPWHPSHSATIAVNHLSMAAGLLVNANRTDESEVADARAIEIADRWCGPPKTLEVRGNRATRASQRGRFAVALAALADLRDAAKAAGVEKVAWQATKDRADLLRTLGDPARALEELDRSRPPEPPTPDPLGDGMAFAQATQASVAGPSASALDALRKASAISEAYSSSLLWHLSRSLCLRELAERDPVRRPEAIAAFAAAEHWHRAYDRMVGASIPLAIYEVPLLLAAGDAERALAKATELSGAFAANPQIRHKHGVLLTYRARALLALGRRPEACAVAKQAAEALAVAGQVESVWRAWLMLAETTDDPSERRIALEAGVAAVEQMRLAPLGWRLDNLYLAPRLPLYRAAIAEAAAKGNGPAALQLIEAVKSRALTAIIGAGCGTAPDADPALVREHAALDEAIHRLQAEALAGAAGEGAADALAEKRHARAELAERLRQADPRWQALTAPDPTPPEAISRAAQGLDAVALDLFLDGAALTAVLVADGGIWVDRHELPSPAVHGLERLVQGLSPPSLDDRTRRPPDERMKDPAYLGFSLDMLLPSAVAARVVAAERVLVGPDSTVLS